MLPSHLSVSLDLLHILLSYAAQLGIDESTILSECGVDLSEYQVNEARIPMQVFHVIWSFIQSRADDTDFGLHYGEYCHRLFTGHLLFAMMMNCENVGQAIQKNFQYHNLVMDIICPKIRTQSTLASLTWDFNHPGISPERHFSESILALFILMLCSLTKGQFRIEEVRFAHVCRDKTGEHERIFQAPLVFGHKRNEIVFLKSYLDTPVLLANSIVLEGLELLVQKELHRAYALNQVAQKVTQVLFKAVLKESSTDIATIARHLALSPRNLQLKLKKENTTFQQLLDNVRKEIAISYLGDVNASICEIALLLNFADQSAFHHAFKRWTGITPGQYRKSVLVK